MLLLQQFVLLDSGLHFLRLVDLLELNRLLAALLLAGLELLLGFWLLLRGLLLLLDFSS